MAFTCPQCGMTSHHPKDEEHKWCNACKEFMDERHWTKRARHFRVEEHLMRNVAGAPCPGFTVEVMHSSEVELYFGQQDEGIAKVWVDWQDDARSIRFKYTGREDGGWTHGIKFSELHTAMATFAKCLMHTKKGHWDLVHEFLKLGRDRQGVSMQPFEADMLWTDAALALDPHIWRPT